MDISGDEIADVVLKEFEKWPSKRKPLVRSDGAKEWVPLSGIVAQGKHGLTCLAAATGMKCLPQNKISQAQGVTLHDWHAEVLAVRAFNGFLLRECHSLAVSCKQSTEYIRRRSQDERTETHFQPFALQDGIKLHIYCSEAPCGDASMELTMAAQEDSTPWDLPPPSSTSSSNPSYETLLLHGRGYFSTLGAVRGKPSRPDAPPTLSKSCSDKLALKQSTSLLSSITSLLISPQNIYLTFLVLPSSQYSETACKRAFSSTGRLEPLEGKVWKGGYGFQEFKVLTTEKEFPYSRRQALKTGEKLVASNIASTSTPTSHVSETLIGGTLQGHKQFSPKGASRVCKRREWVLALHIAEVACVPGCFKGDGIFTEQNYSEAQKLLIVHPIVQCLRAKTYREAKEGSLLEDRRRVKREVREIALRGWVRNEGGEGWGILEADRSALDA